MAKKRQKVSEATVQKHMDAAWPYITFIANAMQDMLRDGWNGYFAWAMKHDCERLAFDASDLISSLQWQAGPLRHENVMSNGGESRRRLADHVSRLKGDNFGVMATAGVLLVEQLRRMKSITPPASMPRHAHFANGDSKDRYGRKLRIGDRVRDLGEPSREATGIVLGLYGDLSVVVGDTTPHNIREARDNLIYPVYSTDCRFIERPSDPDAIVAKIDADWRKKAGLK